MTRHVRIKKGLNIPIRGAPEQSVLGGNRVRHVALCGTDYIGLKPRLLVSKGDAVGLAASRCSSTSATRTSSSVRRAAARSSR